MGNETMVIRSHLVIIYVYNWENLGNCLRLHVRLYTILCFNIYCLLISYSFEVFL